MEPAGIVAVGSSGVTTAALRVRLEPTLHAPSIYIRPVANGGSVELLPKDTQVTVIARTAHRSRIDVWYRYWYLIDIAPRGGAGSLATPERGYVAVCDSPVQERGDSSRASDQWETPVWVYGEFVELQPATTAS